MNTLDAILERYGIKYEDLNELERETYRKDQFNIKTLTVGDVLNNIRMMRDAVSLQLCDEEDPKKNAILKARLKNYILLEGFLSAPGKAQEALDRALKEQHGSEI